MNKYVKKILVTGASLFMMASLGAGLSNTQIHASNYMGSDEARAMHSRRVAVTRPVKLQRMSGSVFAAMHVIGHKGLHRGERIGVVPFYHMGHDGYVVHVPGRKGVYYAATNRRFWGKTHRKARKHYRKHTKRSLKHDVIYVNRKVNRINNNKRLIRKYRRLMKHSRRPAKRYYQRAINSLKAGIKRMNR